MPEYCLPSPPFITVTGVHNFRALLLPSTNKPILYRSATLTQIGKSGAETLEQLRITRIYDLRSKTESLKSVTRDIEGITRVHAPVFAQQDYSPETVALRYKNYASDDGPTGFVKAYEDILESGGSAFREIFNFLRDAGTRQGEEKCLVHCSAGKDRTGVLCALVLMLAGVADEDVAEEYALSEPGIKELKPLMIERLMGVLALEGHRESVERMIGSRKESMLATIEMIREKYGGAQSYLKSHCGLGDEDVEEIRKSIMDGG